MNYEITVEDIENYLESKEDHQIIGVTCDGGKCLVAEAILMKYPGVQVIVGPLSTSVYPYRGVNWAEMTMGIGVSDYVSAFDYLTDLNERPVTKREWLEAQVRA